MSKAERQRIFREWKRGEYVRLARGLFILRADLEALSLPEELILRVVVHACAAPKSVVSGRSAALLWDMPIVESPARFREHKVELTSERARARTTTAVTFRLLSGSYASAVEEKSTDFGTVRLTDALTTALDLARWATEGEAVRALDHGLQHELFALADVRTRVAEMRRLSGWEKIRRAALLASPGSESPRETDLKLLLHELGLPAPWQQVDIFARGGAWIGRADFFFPELALVIEYDGREKYQLDPDDPHATRAKEHEQGEQYRINGIIPLYVCDETLRDGTAAELITEQVQQLHGKVAPYPEHRWSGGHPAWEC
ncbi:hypothetical protein [Corynebacterium nasicanis]|uniref:DUF559 domain-containing protein n=1 Tax=Corynebacterium nasicanis TaxID=1448267 RepID=A0ABW1QEX1_9CORY